MNASMIKNIETKQKIYILVFLLLILLKLFLVRNQPLLAYTNAIHDDRHFIDQARYILGGEWLGPYDQFTLIKGPFLPLWIVFTFLLGIPFLLSLQLLYIFACIITVISLRPLLNRPVYSLVLFIVLLFNPLTYDTYAATRVMRDALYASLCFLAVACAVGLFIRRNAAPVQVLLWAIGLGLTFSAMALTREETVWIVPALLFAFLLSLLGVQASSLKNRLKQVSIWLLPPLIYLLCIGSISFLNYRYYSVFQVTEMKAPEFVAAYGALQRVVPDPFLPMIPVSKETRQRIYPISPAFQELEATLESPNNGWVGITSTETDSPKGEIQGGWFIWAFRDAVASAGHYSEGKFPAQYYQTIANEINTACETGNLSCVSKRASLTPVWNNVYFGPALNDFWRGTKLVTTFDRLTAHPGESSVFEPGASRFRDLTQEEISETPRPTYEISGWVVNTTEDVYITVTKNGEDFTKDTKVNNDISSPDVYDFFQSHGKLIPTAEASRFTVTTPCKICVLEIKAGNVALGKIKMDGLSAPTTWNNGNTFASIESIGTFSSGLVYQNKYNEMKAQVLEGITRIYHWVFPILTVIALLIYVFWTIRVRHLFDNWGVAGVLGITIISRLGLLSIISASSFFSIYTLYLSSVYPIFISFVMFTLIWLFDKMRRQFSANSNNVQEV
jgi:hypothetical protein